MTVASKAPRAKIPWLVDIRRRLSILADAAKYDASCASSGSKRAGTRDGLGNTTQVGICHSYTPDGRCVSLLKILLTNHCIYDCRYCVNRASSDTPRATFTPAEVVWLTMEFYRRNYIEGLFLSSGVIKSPDFTMDLLAQVARSLREDEKFRGYVHLKAVAGASPEAIEAAGRWADRLSANVELPTEHDLLALAPGKSVAEVETTMASIREKIDHAREARADGDREAHFAPAGQSTQMIVGATPSTDATLLATATRLYDRHRLRRVYYSAYSPIPHADAALPEKSPPTVREHRLYQADWLMRFYGFTADEIAPTDAPHLDLAMDPKLAWALRNRHLFPVDVMRADRSLLLRVPGFGVRTVDRIVAARRHRSLRDDDIKRLGAAMTRARPFVITADAHSAPRRLDRADLRAQFVKPTQLSLFRDNDSR